MALEDLIVGSKYNRHHIAQNLGYRGAEALMSGVNCPVNSKQIILFVNRESRPDLPEYKNDFDGEVLQMDGRKDHLYDDRLLESANDGSSVRLFFRDGRTGDFTYFGIMRLLDCEQKQDKPSRFRFVATELIGDGGGPGHDDSDNAFLGAEGKKKLGMHVRYERNQKNREAALRRHGGACVACGLNFDKVYGPELARSYIEVHHTVSVTKLDATPPKIEDLVPLCANCHRMAHRRKGEIVPIQELQGILKRHHI
jgi:hypothetical protein